MRISTLGSALQVAADLGTSGAVGLRATTCTLRSGKLASRHDVDGAHLYVVSRGVERYIQGAQFPPRAMSARGWRAHQPPIKEDA